jgi:hypothetical protein
VRFSCRQYEDIWDVTPCSLCKLTDVSDESEKEGTGIENMEESGHGFV